MFPNCAHGQRHLLAPRLVALLVLASAAVSPRLCVAQDDSPAAKLYNEARQALVEGKVDQALELTAKAVVADPKYVPAWRLRAMVFERKREHQNAIDACSKAISLAEDDAATYNRRGSEYLLAGKFEHAIADFDKAIELDSSLERGHWKRGIAYYYAKEYAKGAEQFALYQTYDNNDVENSVWRFLCMAKDEGVDKARGALLPIENDRRAPLMVVYAMFRGEADAAAVKQAVTEGSPSEEELKLRKFYAHLYLGLYFDALGQTDAARMHLDKAVDQELSGYMWDIAKVHTQYLKADAQLP